jgi:hypothetical protein
MKTSARRHSPYLWMVFIVLLLAATASQVILEGKLARPVDTPGVVWIQSSDLMRRLSWGFSAIWADIYWIRAVQYYGDTKLSTDEKKNYNRLYPLLDVTTTLDPRFNIAYRFGAILLSEGYPNGPGDPDQAMALLAKAMREMPDKWQYYHDAGFVQYWWRRDAQAAAGWFIKGSRLPGAPNWLEPLAAGILAEGGERQASRAMWGQLSQSADHEWIRQTALRGLQQLDAEDQIDFLIERIINPFYDEHGRFPQSWIELVNAGNLRRIPVDPSGTPYTLNPVSGEVDVSKTSRLWPLRGRSVQ